MKDAIRHTYGKKGDKIVAMNEESIDKGVNAMVKIDVPAAWKDAKDECSCGCSCASKAEIPAFIREVCMPINAQDGDSLPVSAFLGREDGSFPSGTSAYEKRGVAITVPEWQATKCIQCNQCAMVCPHAAIRPVLLDAAEAAAAPANFGAVEAKGKELAGLKFKMQVDTLDCMGCGNCADICPVSALEMKPLASQVEKETGNWEYALKVNEKSSLMNKFTVKGSQFCQPLVEFSGACAGCGETPYAKLITQLYGDHMILAQATGCSSIWGGSAPSMPYCKNPKGQGPAWANSLFEDNAEYGYGMRLTVDTEVGYIVDSVDKLLSMNIPEDVKAILNEWKASKDDGEKSKAAAEKVLSIVGRDLGSEANALLSDIARRKDYLAKKSVWIFGGDGWAYDIGFGGLDHVLASGEDVNVFVFDTEVYSNTGGQSSKATPTAAVAKFTAAGKRVKKKDLGRIAMTYGYVYVAQVAMGADKNQLMKAVAEAEAYKGPSLIISYAPCINHGIAAGMGKSQEQEKKAVEAGYWHLYRYNPMLADEGKNPFILDSKEPKADFKEFLMSEVRYSSLVKTFPEIADTLFDKAAKEAKARYEAYRAMAEAGKQPVKTEA